MNFSTLPLPSKPPPGRLEALYAVPIFSLEFCGIPAFNLQ
jgi:hypothetical protein